MASIYHETARLAAWMVLVLPGIVMLGCDRPPPMNPEVPTEGKFSSSSRMSRTYPIPRANWSECESCSPRLRTIERSVVRYPAYRYEGKPPVLSGDSATVTVILKDAKTGDPAARYNGR